MSLYDSFKDVLNIAQKADNVELYRQLLDLSAEALELQSKVNSLTQENERLKKEMQEEKSIQRHTDGNYITLIGDEEEIRYCSTCWGNEKKLIQLMDDEDVREGLPKCPVCFNEWLAARNGNK